MKAKSIVSCLLILSMFLSMAFVSNAAHLDPAPTPVLKENAKIAEKLALEGMILLENNGALPIRTRSVALFGVGAVRTYRGGSGSGDPWNGGLSGGGDPRSNQNPRWNVNIYDAFKKAGYTVTNAEYLEDLGNRFDKQFGETMGGMDAFRYPEDELTEEMVAEAAEGTDTAIFVIARNAGEGSDRSVNPQYFNVRINGPDQPAVRIEVGDYNLLPKEIENLRKVGAAFDNVIVVINCGGQIDTKFFREIPGLDALVFMGQAGQEGGAALVKLLSGQVNFSGKTINTWAKNYSDYPASATFANNDGTGQDERYVEGIYVGYRYFDTAGITPAYPFGYGLSYTTFDIDVLDIEADEETVSVKVNVKNTGNYAGKEVVQVYYSAPDGEGGDRAYQTEKPYQELIVYAKTSLLQPGESQTLTLSYNTRDMAYYNEKDEGYALDPGDYIIRVGNSSRNTHVAAVLRLDAKVITEKLKNLLHTDWRILEEREPVWSKKEKGWTPYTYEGETQEIQNAKVINLDSSKIETVTHVYKNLEQKVTTYTTNPDYEPQTRGYQEYSRNPVSGPNGTLGFTGAMVSYEEEVEVVPKEDITLLDVYKGEKTLEQLVAQMTTYELATLNCGSGWGVWDEHAPIISPNYHSIPGCAAETTRELEEKYGIPFYIVNDGPGGLRVRHEFVATDVTTGEKVTVYNYSTAWPVSIVRAATWNLELLNEFGYAYGKEMEDMGISILLGTSLNIHRDPLCGRNFEYYSEDPRVAGYTTAAITKGLQSTPGIGACLKHFAANNQETRRGGGNSVMTERTAREIYLKGFEIAVKAAQPMSIMTSYNLLNNVPTGDDYNLLENITRDEWGFEGNIMTDWGGGQSTPAKSMHAGNDFITPGGPAQVRRIMQFVEILPPKFKENGEIDTYLNISASGITKAFDWGGTSLNANGTNIVRAPLGEGYTATLGDEVAGGYREILVNGERIIRTANFSTFRGSKEDAINGGVVMTNPQYLTTQYASIEEGGKAILYKCNPYNTSINICRGDLQKSAINNLKVLMQTLGAKKYFAGNSDVNVTPWSDQFELRSYYSVTIEGGSEKAVLSSPASVEPGDSFEVGIELGNLERNVYAQDITLTYDADIFEYVSVSSVNDDIKILKEDTATDGRVRLIAANIGGLSGTDNRIFNLIFKVKDGIDNAAGNIAITSAKLGVAPEGTVIEAAIDSKSIVVYEPSQTVDKTALIAAINNAQNLYNSAVVGTEPGQYPQESKDALYAAINAAKTVRNDAYATQSEVDNAVIALNNAVEIFKASVNKSADLNNDGTINVGDLAIVAYYYGVNSESPNWNEAVIADMNNDKTIDITDLAYIALKIPD